jgi:hypothetical protein
MHIAPIYAHIGAHMNVSTYTCTLIHATVRAAPANDIRVEVFTERHLATTCLDALALAPSNFPRIIERARSHMTRAHVRSA